MVRHDRVDLKRSSEANYDSHRTLVTGKRSWRCVRKLRVVVNWMRDRLRGTAESRAWIGNRLEVGGRWCPRGCSRGRWVVRGGCHGHGGRRRNLTLDRPTISNFRRELVLNDRRRIRLRASSRGRWRRCWCHLLVTSRNCRHVWSGAIRAVDQ